MDATLDDRAVAAVRPARVDALRRMLGAFMTTRAARLAARVGRGLLGDGHGDLRAEHVLLTDPPEIVELRVQPRRRHDGGGAGGRRPRPRAARAAGGRRHRQSTAELAAGSIAASHGVSQRDATFVGGHQRHSSDTTHWPSPPGGSARRYRGPCSVRSTACSAGR